jgi:NAD(P)H-dependent FMN reductase
MSLPSPKKKILAVAGSLRANSSTHQVLQLISLWIPSSIEWVLFDELDQLPHFNDDSNPPASVLKWRQAILESNGVLICTPEYGFGAPGFLKNALDWTISSGEFVGKPVGLVTAATNGENAHTSLLLTLKGITSHLVPEATLLISYIRSKMNKNGEISDPTTFEALQRCVNAFFEEVASPKEPSIRFQ